jgi:hypothetical protein
MCLQAADGHTKRKWDVICGVKFFVYIWGYEHEDVDTEYAGTGPGWEQTPPGALVIVFVTWHI